jgi:hypothetical protein
MPILFVVSLLIDVALVVHVLKTGRNTIWIWVVVLLPMAGPIAYLLIEILPGLGNSRTARRIVTGTQRTLDPTRDLRQAELRLRGTDSIEGRVRMAEELSNHHRHAEAIEHYRQALTGLYLHDPNILLGLARAQFAMQDAGGARETLDRLIKENPDFRSADGHLLYARALTAEGNVDKARSEFAELVKYFPGAEAKYRYAMLLRAAGDQTQARQVLVQLLNEAELAAKHFRKIQKQWLDAARRELDTLQQETP